MSHQIQEVGKTDRDKAVAQCKWRYFVSINFDIAEFLKRLAIRQFTTPADLIARP